jgi:hypothetical protein
VQPAGEASEQPRRRERDEAHVLRTVPDELGALGVVTHRVAHPPDRCSRERIHRERREHRPDDDRVIDRKLRAQRQPEVDRRARAAGGDAFFAAEQPGSMNVAA